MGGLGNLAPRSIGTPKKVLSGPYFRLHPFYFRAIVSIDDLCQFEALANINKVFEFALLILHKNRKDGRVRATAAGENRNGYTAAFVANHDPSKCITDFAQGTFMKAKQTTSGNRPQAIAHRGYKASHPENTMSAFKGAVEVGAHAIETDIHITKDGVVVLSHVGAGTSIIL